MNNKPHSDDAKKKMRNARLGKFMHSEETKMKISKSRNAHVINNKIVKCTMIDGNELIFLSITLAANYFNTTVYKIKHNKIPNCRFQTLDGCTIATAQE